MAKFFGPVGYAETEESSPGVWTEVITEYNYYGDIIKNMNRIRDGEQLNVNVTIDNQISIVADEFAYNHCQSMRYVKWLGALWKISSITVQRPRLLLSIGDIYNGPVPIIPEPEDEGDEEP